MKFSIGLITKGDNYYQIYEIIKSVESQGIPNYEIVIIGGDYKYNQFNNIIHVPFNDDVKPNWITRKKNLITDNSSGDIIVYMHDYIKLNDGWYNGYQQFGYNWDICMNVVNDLYDRRFYDWITWDHPNYKRYHPLSYDDAESSIYTFIPGGYWVAKKEVMINNRLNEDLIWGQSEDVEWSLRVRHLNYKMNKYSSVKHLKKHRGFDELVPLSIKY